MTEKAAFRSGFITIIGRPNVGKSTLMNALIGEKVAIVSPKPQTTRNRIMGILNGEGYQVVFLDTPGLHNPHTQLGEFMIKSAREALEGTDLLMAMADMSDFGKEDSKLLQEMGNATVPRILVLNKADLVEEGILMQRLQQVSDFGYDEVVPVSARTGWNLEELRNTILKHLPVGPRYFPEDMITDQPERLICAEIIREKALRHLKDEVPHGVGVEMQRIAPLGEQLTEIYATIYCEKQSHKGIIIGKGGSMLRQIGEEARHDMERLLGTHIHLQLWVKVREDWRNRKSDLRTLGYDV